MADFDLVDQTQKIPELLRLAEASVKIRDWVSADQFYQAATYKDETLTSRIAFGVYLAERERFNEAIAVFTPVLDSSNHTAIGIVSHNLAAIYRILGDLDLARRFQWRSTMLQPDLDSADLLAMANDALTQGRTDIAASLVDAAEEIVQSDDQNRGDSLCEVDIEATSGLIQASDSFTEEAIIALFRTYYRRRSLGDRRGMGVDLLNMATLFAELNRHRAERACLVRAVKCFQEEAIPFSYQTACQRLDQVNDLQSVRSFDVRRN